MVSSASAWLDGGGDPLPLELGARIELLEQRVLTHLLTCTECVTPSRLELQRGPGRHARLCLLRQGFRRNGCARFYYCERLRPFWDHVGEWTACIEPKQLVLLDVGYVMDNVLPPFQGKKRVVFLAILAVARMVIWTTIKKGLYNDEKFSHRDLVLPWWY